MPMPMKKNPSSTSRKGRMLDSTYNCLRAASDISSQGANSLKTACKIEMPLDDPCFRQCT